MTVHIPPDRHLPSQEAVDLVVALQRCLTNFHARKEEPAILDGETVKLKSLTEVRYDPAVVRVLCIHKDA